MSFVESVNQGESLASWLNWLTEPPCCVLVCDHGRLINQLKRSFLDPSKGLQNGSTKLCCAQHDLQLVCPTLQYGNRRDIQCNTCSYLYFITLHRCTKYKFVPAKEIGFWSLLLINTHCCSCFPRDIDGILPKGPYPPCLRMANRALLAGYPRYVGWGVLCRGLLRFALVWSFSQYHSGFLQWHWGNIQLTRC